VPELRRFGAGTERPRTLVVGCGGAGCNALHVVPTAAGLDVLAVNDLPHPSLHGIKRRLLLPKAGLREVAAMDERAVKALATTAEQSAAVEIADADFVVAVAGLGGEMGSWGASLFARVAALKGAATLAVVTTPFSAEGVNRHGVAEDALAVLRQHAHGTVALPNDGLLKIAPHLPIMKAFEAMSRVAIQPVYDLVRVVTRDDLTLMKTVLRNASEWTLGLGEGFHDHPALAAVDVAFRSPWLTKSVGDAREAIVLVSTPEPDERTVQDVLHDVDLRAPRASVTWGALTGADPDSVRVTVLVGR
jgi:cell division protein FtsZ